MWWTRLAAALVISMCATVRAQSIFTVAGGGPIGDGKPATQALLKLPADTVLDSAGNLYIADTNNHRVRKVDARTGVVTTIAGGGTSGLGDGGPATEAELLSPTGVAVDGMGNVYVSTENRVRKVDAGSGVITTYAGGGNPEDGIGDGLPATAGRLGHPRGLTFDSRGNLVIADAGAARIRRVDVNTGIITTIAGGIAGFGGDGGPALQASFRDPADVLFDRNGNLYIVETGNHRIRRVAGDTQIIATVAGDGTQGGQGDGLPATQASVWFPNNIVIDQAGNLIFDSCCSSIRKVDIATGLISTIAGGNQEGFGGDGGAALSARLNFPKGVSIDGSDNLYIADQLNHRVRIVNAADQIITTVAGGGSLGDGGPATTAQLFAPWGVVRDASDNLFISDAQAYRVRKVDLKTGTITTYAGNGDANYGGDGGPATAASFFQPWGLAIDAAGNLYIATRFGRIRRVDANTGIITTVAGNDNPDRFTSDDPQPAATAGLNHPQGVEVDAAGNIYIADTENHRVRKVTISSGILTTIAGSGPPTLPDSPGSGAFGGDGGPATAARLNSPSDVALDTAAHVYIADRGNGRIRKVDAVSGVISTIAGGGDSPEDGVPATAAALHSPYRL